MYKRNSSVFREVLTAHRTLRNQALGVSAYSGFNEDLVYALSTEKGVAGLYEEVLNRMTTVLKGKLELLENVVAEGLSEELSEKDRRAALVQAMELKYEFLQGINGLVAGIKLEE